MHTKFTSIPIENMHSVSNAGITGMAKGDGLDPPPPIGNRFKTDYCQRTLEDESI